MMIDISTTYLGKKKIILWDKFFAEECFAVDNNSHIFGSLCNTTYAIPMTILLDTRVFGSKTSLWDRETYADCQISDLDHQSTCR